MSFQPARTPGRIPKDAASRRIMGDEVMWWTSEGERVLRKGEWDLFREGLAALWEHIEDAMKHEPLFHSGIAAFDDLQPEQQLALLALVGKALRDATADVPELTAHTEATVAAIF